jgi:DNA-binding MarR family transcriptional regulator
MVKQFDGQMILADQVVGLVSALIRAEHRHAAHLARRLGLPAADTLALYHLANEPLRSRDLGERLGLTAGSVTALVDRLVARDLARRSTHARDRRVVLVEMTEAGHAQTWQVLQHFIGQVVHLAGTRSAADRRVIGRFLAELIEAVDVDTGRLQGEGRAESKDDRR